VNLRHRNQFPNWSLALEFLKRSPVNVLVSHDIPPDDTPAPLRRRLLLHGIDGKGGYLCFPQNASDALINRVARAVLENAHADELDFSLVRSSNFVAFLEQFTSDLAGKFDLREVAQAVTDKTRRLFEAEGVSILMPTDDGRWRFAVVTAESEEIAERLDQLVVSGQSGITGWVAAHRRSILVNNDNRDAIYDPEVDRRTHFQTREVLAGPIMVGKDMIGLLQVVSRRNGAFQKSDLQILELVAAIIASFMDKARLYDERLKLAKVNKELEIARELQLAMMPHLPADIGPFTLHGESRQISTVGGDFWDVLRLSDKERLLILGDVSGHGLSAALVMSAVRTASRALMARIGEPDHLIEPLNLLLHEDFGLKGHYATLLFIHLHLEHGTVRYLRAGHEYPVRRSGDTLTRMRQPGSWPLGLFPFRQDDVWHDIELGPDACLYLYTDGVLDGLDDEEPEMEDVLRRNPFLETALDDGTFFETLTTRMGWREVDDATMLKLSLR